MLTRLRPALLLLVTIALAACTGAAASPTPSPGASSPPPDASPSPTPGAFGEIEHPTGATDIVLRYEEGGGFVMPAFLASQTPIFTLYGDGTVVFRNPMAEPPPPVGNVQPNGPLRIAKLTEAQIQAVLERALGPGGLGVARPHYENNLVADASTATFTVNAGGLKKTVSVYALGMETQGGQDAAARAAFQSLAQDLADFDRGGAFSSEVYSPEHYRGILSDGFGAGALATPWPWTDLQPADFVVPADPEALQFPSAVLTVEQVEALGITPYQGGFMNLTLNGPDNKVYSFALRPLLPDETS